MIDHNNTIVTEWFYVLDVFLILDIYNVFQLWLRNVGGSTQV